VELFSMRMQILDIGKTRSMLIEAIFWIIYFSFCQEVFWKIIETQFFLKSLKLLMSRWRLFSFLFSFLFQKGNFLPLGIWNKVSVNQIQLFLTKCKRHCICLLNSYRDILFLLSIKDWFLSCYLCEYFTGAAGGIFSFWRINFYYKWRNMIWNLSSVLS